RAYARTRGCRCERRAAAAAGWATYSAAATICLPLYVPQVGQTRCDRTGAAQFGQLATLGGLTFQWARRWSRFCLEVRFFGTPTADSSSLSMRARRRLGRGHGLENAPFYTLARRESTAPDGFVRRA